MDSLSFDQQPLQSFFFYKGPPPTPHWMTFLSSTQAPTGSTPTTTSPTTPTTKTTTGTISQTTGTGIFIFYCTARQCSLLRRNFKEGSIINPALSRLMKHLVGQRQEAPNFSAFPWSPHGTMVSIGQHFVTTREVDLQKRTETSLITESDRSGPNHKIGPGCAGRA